MTVPQRHVDRALLGAPVIEVGQVREGIGLTFASILRAMLRQAPNIAVEIRPEGVLLRPEQEDEVYGDAILGDMLPQDAAPDRKGLFHWLRRLTGHKEKAS